MVKFSNPPFAFVLKLAFDKIPYFGAFRDAYHKSGVFYLLSYFLLSGIGFYLITQYLLEKQKRFFLWLLFVFVLIAGIVLTGPYFLFFRDNIIKLRFIFNNKNYTISAKTKIPKEYYDLQSFFSNKCGNKTTLIVPRGGWISNAHWTKYGTSYVSIDLIPQLIDCQFITTIIFPQEPEISNQSVFLLLERKDTGSFKKYLLERQIGFIIIRKDHIPFAASSWMYVNPEIVRGQVEKDKDFSKIYTNDYFDVYKFSPLEKINNYGFALPEGVIYTDLDFTKMLDFSTLSKKMSSEIGKVVINSKDNYKQFSSLINSYLSSAKCIECDNKKENSESQTIKREIRIYKDGQYACEADRLDLESKISSFDIEEQGVKEKFSEPAKLQLAKGKYSVDINYSTKHIIDLSQEEFKEGEYVKIPLGRISQGDYWFSFDAENKERYVEILLTKNELSNEDIKTRKYGEEGKKVVFTSPLSPSEKEIKVSRVFTTDYWTNDNYYLYLHMPKDKLISTDKSLIKNLAINKVVKPEDIIFSCSFEDKNINSVFTSEVKVVKKTPVFYQIVFPKNFSKGFLTFNQTYHDNWVAYYYKDGKKQYFNHLKNGYSNGWYIDSVPAGEVFVEFTTQKPMEENAIVSLIVFVGVMLVYLRVRKKDEKNKGKATKK